MQRDLVIAARDGDLEAYSLLVRAAFPRLDIGIRLGGVATDAVIEGNRFCGNEQDLVGPEGSNLPLGPSNEVCDEPETE